MGSNLVVAVHPKSSASSSASGTRPVPSASNSNNPSRTNHYGGTQTPQSHTPQQNQQINVNSSNLPHQQQQQQYSPHHIGAVGQGHYISNKNSHQRNASNSLIDDTHFEINDIDFNASNNLLLMQQQQSGQYPMGQNGGNQLP
jgi:hypothetical protein